MEEVLLVDDITVEEASPKGGIITIWTLNRPNKLNALNNKIHEEIKKQCIRAESDDNVRVIIIRGAPPLPIEEGQKGKPPSFAAGADISEFENKNSDDVRPFFEDNAWEAVWNLSKPTIAMVDGFALGGGTELALSCDIRFASERSNFGQPEINLGLIPGGGGTQRLSRLLGYGKAMEIILSGNMIGAEEALRIGLINAVHKFEDLEKSTISFAKKIAKQSPHTIKVAKRTIRASLDLPFSEGILTERSEFVALFDTEDKEIGVKAFLQRKDALWLGK